MTTISPTVRGTTTVGEVLAAVHETWMEQVTTLVTPALNEDSDFWSRWSVARFLSDQFRNQFRLERVLIDDVAPLVSEETTRTLAEIRARLERTVEELMIAARRRATGLLTARLARRFIDQLALWYVEVELATGEIETSDLPPEPSRLLTGLQAHALWS
jgi:hypothetical protein